MTVRQVPYRQIPGLDAEAARQIDRNFDDVLYRISKTAVGSVVVADDGSGNYTSIKSAIDAIPAGNTAEVWIVVKPPVKSALYDDSGLGLVSVGNKRFVVSAAAHGSWRTNNSFTPEAITWKSDGLSADSAIANGRVGFVGLQFTTGATNPLVQFVTNAGVEIGLKDCRVNMGGIINNTLGWASSNQITVAGLDTYVQGGVFQGGGSIAAGNISMRFVGGALTIFSGATTLAGPATFMAFGADVTVGGSSSSMSVAGTLIVLAGCGFTAGSATFGGTVYISGATESSSSDGRITLAGNVTVDADLPFTDITVNAGAKAYVAGVFRSVTIACSNGLFATYSAAVAMSVTGSANLILDRGGFGGTLAVGANNNQVITDGTWTNSGTGNLINFSGVTPGGAASGDLTGTYPGPTLAAFGPGATGPIGDDFTIPVVTVDGKGRVSGLTSHTNRKPHCRVYSTLTPSIATATLTSVAFNSERYDVDAMHDPVTNNSRITVGRTGLWTIGANIFFVANVTGFRGVLLRVNGTKFVARNYMPAVPGGGDGTAVPITTDIELTSGDYFEVIVYQTSGGALTLVASDNVNEFDAQEAYATWQSPA